MLSTYFKITIHIHELEREVI